MASSFLFSLAVELLDHSEKSKGKRKRNDVTIYNCTGEKNHNHIGILKGPKNGF